MKPFYLHQKHQEMLLNEKRFQIPVGGRGGMKTEAVARILISKARSEQNTKILCTRKFQASVKDSVYSVIVQAIWEAELDQEFDIQKSSITHIKSGSSFIFYGLQHIMEIKSMKGIKYCWIEEAQFMTSEILEILSPTLRILGAQIYMVFNPDLETDWIYQTFIVNKHPMANVVWTSYLDNPFFTFERVGSSYTEMEYDKESDLIKYEHKWLGKCRSEIKGALWNKKQIKYVQRDEYIETIETSYEKIVISVDPSAGDKINQDECGIIVVGELKGKYYILEDASFIAPPGLWAAKVVGLWEKWKANYVIAEGNQGHAMINTIINNINPAIKIKRVNARRGKYLRAEPVAALYEQDKVRHLKCFPELEYEMLTYTGAKSEKSPNRLDALVWGLTEYCSLNRAPRGMVKANIGTMRLRQ